MVADALAVAAVEDDSDVGGDAAVVVEALFLVVAVGEPVGPLGELAVLVGVFVLGMGEGFFGVGLV